MTRAAGTNAYVHLDPPGPPADTWGLGATLHKAEAGELQFTDGARLDVAPAEVRGPQLAGRPRPAGGIHLRFAEAIAACLRRDLAARPSPSELPVALEPILESLPRPRLSRLEPAL